MSVDVLFIINGLGLGNSTRCHAIIQKLKSLGATVGLVTASNGLWYFKDRGIVDSIDEINSLYYKKRESQISIAGTLSSIPDFIRIWRGNARRIGEILDRLTPKVVVVDSEYTFWPIKARKIPMAALNNADVVVDSYWRYDTPRDIAPQFFAVETPDYFFHKVVPDVVLSPSLDPNISTRYNGIHRVGPIVREGYIPAPYSPHVQRVVVMLSGSQFRSAVSFHGRNYPFTIDVVGRDRPESDPIIDNVTYHGRLLDNYDILNGADLIVVNGGFSAVSEAFSMRIPMIVLPISRHAEQWMNGRIVESLGVGKISALENLETVLFKAADEIEDYRAAYDKLKVIPDGAMGSARKIMDMTK